MKDLTIRSDKRSPPISRSINLSVASRRSVRVYLDGCPTSESRYNCRGNDSVLVYSGKETQATDYSLQPFTGNTTQSTCTIIPEIRCNVSINGFGKSKSKPQHKLSSSHCDRFTTNIQRFFVFFCLWIFSWYMKTYFYECEANLPAISC